MNDPLKPSPAVLCKLGSIVVHVSQLLSKDGHHFDRVALEQLLDDPELERWLAQMAVMAMLPVMRKSKAGPAKGAGEG